MYQHTRERCVVAVNLISSCTYVRFPAFICCRTFPGLFTIVTPRLSRLYTCGVGGGEHREALVCGIIIHVISDAYTLVPLRFPDRSFILESVAPNPKSTVEARGAHEIGRNEDRVQAARPRERPLATWFFQD